VTTLSDAPISAAALRNIAIIAHVDHGKTTLTDQLLAQGGAYRENEARAERAMDSNPQEKERGITILAKCTSIVWGEGADEVRINIVDTPGHADFGGEVERVLSMVDGCLLLVDATEGPMPQTKFVLSKALALGLKPIVVLNKVDRPTARPDEVLDEVFELFMALNASNEQLDFPSIYASGRDGWATMSLDEDRENLAPLFEAIIKHVPAPESARRRDEPFRMLVTMLDSDPFLGRILTGRVESGRLTAGATVKGLSLDGQTLERSRVSKVLAFRGLKRQPIEEAEAGDIVSIAGLSQTTVADTIVDMDVSEAIKATPIDPPTLSVNVMVNSSPLAGRDGDKVQSRVIRDRLWKQAETDVAIKVTESTDKDSYELQGRGELQIGVLIEGMRREGFELSISRPRVLTRKDEATGEKLEPIEEVVIDVDDEFTGPVVEKMSIRKGELQDMRPSGGGKTRLTFLAPARGLIGYHSEFLTDTRGSGIMNRLFHSWAPWKGPIAGRRNGALIANDTGKSVVYALWYLEERGVLFIDGGEDVYQGMIIGENAKPDDLDVNPLKEKKLSNVRSSGKDEAMRLTPPRRMTLEQAISWIDEDELVEVTPKAIRIRKQEMNPSFRKKRIRAD
jgi:GTP-binding protein